MTSWFAAAGLSLPGLVCAACAGLAVFWLFRPPVRLSRVADPKATSWLGRQFAVWAKGRPGAPSLARRCVLGGVTAGALCVAGSSMAGGPGPLSWLACPLIWLALLVALGWLEPLNARQRRYRLILETPQALELMAACLAAGMPVRKACAAVVAAFDGPVAEELGRVLSVVSLGLSDAEAWRGLRDHPQLGPAAQDLARSVESGLMLTESLRHHAAVARDRRQAARQVQARRVGVRSVLPLMTCFIPAFMLLGVVPTVASAISHAFSSF